MPNFSYLDKTTNLADYPNIQKRLTAYKDLLQKKREVKLGRQQWYVLHWPREAANFERSPKILVQCIRNLSLRKRVVATIDQEGLYADHTLNVIFTNKNEYDLKYLLAILNSDLVNYLFLKKYIDINIKGVYLEAIPIRKIDFSNDIDKKHYKEIIQFVDTILELKEREYATRLPDRKQQIQRSEEAILEQINNSVYELYGLTANERKLVSESSAKN
ncbi:MAG: TaqI-like C-terminal specificity domain-containing protein [Nitrososphaerales archaeon]